MKTVKRRTKIECPYCMEQVIGYKYPPRVEGFSCHVEYNESASRDNVRFKLNGQLNITRVCQDCEGRIRK